MATAVPPTSVAPGRISCKCAAAESSCSQSGKLLSDIYIPEVISLCVWIGQVRFGHSKNPLADVRARRGDITQFFPVIEPTTSDHVVDRGERPVGMIQVTVQHAGWIIAA